MKIAVKAAEERYWKYKPEGDFNNLELVFFPIDAPDEDILATAADAEVLAVDAISGASAALMDGMPQLKMIQSEGVGYNGIDVAAATERDILVCNNPGINATAVAEQAILLMLGLLRSVISGNEAVLAGKQIATKERLMVEGIRELADCKVGLIGLGNIGVATARLLGPFGCPIAYNSRTRKPELEAELGLVWEERDQLVSSCDIVSLHCPVTPETTEMVNAEFLATMKDDALLINTGRGDLVDNEALVAALEAGTIGGAGLDTIAPEPVLADNPLLNMSEQATARLLASPHVGGITTSTFRRGFASTWTNFARIRDGKRPNHVVNGG